MVNVLMDHSLRMQLYLAGLQSVLRVWWGNMYSCWFPILAGLRQGGIISPLFLALYIDRLIIQQRRFGLGCSLYDEFFGSLAV